MQSSHSEREHSGSRVAVTISAVVLLVYVLCPGVFLLPLALIYGRTGTPPPAIRKSVYAFLVPVNMLYTRIPVYRALRDKEAQVLGLR